MIWKSWTSTLRRSITFRYCSARRASRQNAPARFPSRPRLRERLVAATPAADPNRERYLSNLGSCYGNLGTANLDDGAPDEAIAWTRKALAIQDEQIKKHPNSVDYLERVGANHMVLGSLESRTNHLAGAKGARAGTNLPRAFKARSARRRGLSAHLAECFSLLASVEFESSSNTLALDWARRAVSETDGDPPDQPQVSSRIGPARQLFADRSRDIAGHRRIRACSRECRSAEAILRQLVASYPELSRYRFDLAATIAAHVRMESEIGRHRRRGGSTPRGRVHCGGGATRRSRSNVECGNHG